jgi:uncharacterized protein
MHRVEVAGATLELWPERAAYLPDHATLLVADVHVGKDASFRRLGVPVPPGATESTLQRLSRVLGASGAARLVVLGDFLHSAQARSAHTLEALSAWRARHPGVDITLLRGNHDHRAGDPPAALGIEVVDAPLALGPFRLAHEPGPHEAGYVLAGHVHPCVVLGGRGPDRLRLPCFHFGLRVGVLPAFGAFTGGHAMPRAEGDRVYAIAEDTVRAV